MLLYDDADCAALSAAIPQMMRDGEALKSAHVAPTQDQRAAVSAMVLAFVRHRGRKVYGGHALNAALLDLSPEDAIYSAGRQVQPADEQGIIGGGASDIADIEFYSPDPIADVVELCDRLFAAGHSYVQGREAMHHGTFTISVEFKRVCDVSFFPRPAYDHLPVRASDPSSMLPFAWDPLSAGVGPPVLTIDPAFAAIDHLKILCDPFTSYWKLDRMLPRLLLIQKHFPLSHPFLPPPPPPPSSHGGKRAGPPPLTATEMSVVTTALAWAADHGTLAVVGEHALSYFKEWADVLVGAQTQESQATPCRDPLPRHLTMVSVAYADDLEALVSFAEAAGEAGKAASGEQHAPRVRLTEYYPFADMLGRRTTLRLRAGGAPLITLIDARSKAVPVCGRGRDGAPVCSLTYAMMTSMALRFLARADSRSTAERDQGEVIASLMLARRVGLTAIGLTVADEGSPFRDTHLAFIGQPLSEMRIHMGGTDERRVRAGPNAMVWFTYDPNRNGAGGVRGRGKGGRGGQSRGGGQGQHRQYMLLRCDGAIVSPGDSVLMARRTERSLAETMKSMALDWTKVPDAPDAPEVFVS